MRMLFLLLPLMARAFVVVPLARSRQTTLMASKIEEEPMKMRVLRAVRQEPQKSYFGSTVSVAVVFASLFPALTKKLLPGDCVSAALGAAMFCAACTLSLKDVTSAFSSRKKALVGGVCAQFLLMPSLAFVFAKLNALSSIRDGVLLVGCCPGGAASNVVALLANADVALSIAMTASSTFIAAFLTPQIFQWFSSSSVTIDPSRFYAPLLSSLLIPTVLGVLWNEKAPKKMAAFMKKIAPTLSSIIIALIVAKVVADVRLLAIVAPGVVTVPLFVTLLASLVFLHSSGFGLGYLTAKQILRLPSRQSRAIAIEVGMQNSALAVVLATAGLGAAASTFDTALASLPGATSACTHALLGGLLATYWRRKDTTQTK